MEQAGINTLSLYNVEDTSLMWIDANTVSISSGTSIELTDYKPKLSIDPIRSNRKLKFNYELTIEIPKLTESVRSQIQNNVYGWYLNYTLNNGNEQFIKVPFFIVDTYTLNTNETNNRVIKLRPNVISEKFKDILASPESLNPILWLDPLENIDTSTVGADVFIDKWTDKINGYEFEQLTGADRPKFLSNSVYFDGSKKYSLDKLTDIALTDFTIFIVATPLTSANILAYLTGSSITQTAPISLGSSSFYGSPTYGVGVNRYSLGIDLGSKKIYQADNLDNRIDNIIPAYTSDIDSAAFNINTIGWRGTTNILFYTGNIYDIIIYDKILTDSERTDVYNYLKVKNAII